MKAFAQIEYKTEEVTNTYGKFILSPLEGGFGITIGNAMRRVLLSSIPGASIFSVEIEGARHEFSTLDNIVEDCTAIVLNLKDIVLKIDSDEDDNEPRVLELDVKNEGHDGEIEVKASDFVLPHDVTIVNPGLVIAHVAEGGHLKMVVKANKGRGYQTFEQNKHTYNCHNGVIAVDSLYSPMLKLITLLNLLV